MRRLVILLVSVRICSACGVLRKQEVTYQCNKLIYSMEIENLDCHAVICSDYWILIPAEYADLPTDLPIPIRKAHHFMVLGFQMLRTGDIGIKRVADQYLSKAFARDFLSGNSIRSIE